MYLWKHWEGFESRVHELSVKLGYIETYQGKKLD